MASVGINFVGKVALITGSSSGIGAATAKYFAKLGCAVALSGRNEQNLQEVQKECIELGASNDKVIYHVGDVTDETFMKRMVDGTVQKFGKLNILVNNAAIALGGNTQEGKIESFDQQMNTNVRAVIQLTKLCIPHIVKEKGAIVNVSSVGSIRGTPLFTYYCMTKAALDMFTKCLALELAPQGVRVNSMNPGFVATALRTRSSINEEQERQFQEHYKNITPLGRIGQPEDIAQTIAYLASDQASFTTGQLIVADGGLILAGPR